MLLLVVSSISVDSSLRYVFPLAFDTADDSEMEDFLESPLIFGNNSKKR